MSYQKTTLVGALSADAELRYTASGTPVASFSIPINEKWKDASGTQQEKTTWFRVAIWNKLAESLSPYLVKGKWVLVEGELSEPRTYTAKDGTTKASLDLKAFTVKFVGPRVDLNESQTSTVTGSLDDDMPF